MQICKNDKIICKYCGQEICRRPDVCKRFRQKNNVYEKYLGFNSNKKGTSNFNNEFDSVVSKLKEDYLIMNYH